MKFEWDSRKNKINIRKHDVDFRDAQFVFYDPNAVEIFDAGHSQNEERYIVIGFVHTLLSVVYVERSKNIRIISARKANKREEELYYDSKA